MKYAEVAVNVAGGSLHSFSYSIPSTLNIRVGHGVLVPFGSKVVQGVVVELTDTPGVPETKEIIDLIDPEPVVTAERVSLAVWISQYYASPLFDAIALMLPPGFERRITTFIELSALEANYPDLSEQQNAVINFIKSRGGGVRLEDLYADSHISPIKEIKTVIQSLLTRKIICKTFLLEKKQVKPKVVEYIKLNIDIDQAASLIDKFQRAGKIRQAQIIELLNRNAGVLSLTQIKSQVDCTRTTVNALIKKGIIQTEFREIKRDPIAKLEFAMEFPLTFTTNQEVAWKSIASAIETIGHNPWPQVFLLFGVTGSGKTEIYLRAFEEVIKRGKKGIFLVPEISLTTQMIGRFYARFPGKVAAIHSKLTQGEQYDAWHSINDGAKDIVIGPRSAVFSPQKDLGLIVVDEEHDWSYKQMEKAPRYHAREVAIKLAQLTGALVILGSATPDIVTFYKGQRGDYQLVELKERVTLLGSSLLPEVHLINLREEFKAGNRGLFSRLLKEKITSALKRHEQIILYINRRGLATLVRCNNCGYAMTCKRCSTVLTYHLANNRLVCHHCRRAYLPLKICPKCFKGDMKYLGIGTETVESECRKLYPEAKILRFDSDLVTKIKDYEDVIRTYRAHKADILIGTQMVAKGLDFPQVSLVGVINADVGLNIPDVRSAERTFQLLCQVSGRAGRGYIPGEAIIQTYNPTHYAIKYAARQDYFGFYSEEIKYRRSLGYPPFGQIVRLLYSHSNFEKCRTIAEKMRADIINIKERKGIADLKIIGPYPAHVTRLRGKFQMQIILLSQSIDRSKILEDVKYSAGWIVDVDPVSMV